MIHMMVIDGYDTVIGEMIVTSMNFLSMNIPLEATRRKTLWFIRDGETHVSAKVRFDVTMEGMAKFTLW